jgi:GntR family transcriptional regulator
VIASLVGVIPRARQAYAAPWRARSVVRVFHAITRQEHPSIDRGVWLSLGLAGYLDAVTVDHEGPQPVYQQIAAILRAQIEAGEVASDRPIPSEATLMQRYGVARETARKAVRVLVAEGLVYVVQGRGAYVAKRAT